MIPGLPPHVATSALIFLALVGPPAAGKSTVTGALRQQHASSVFRLREFARSYQSRAGDDDLPILATDDPLGWFSDSAVDLLLRAAFLEGQADAGPRVVFEGFPGTGAQVHLLAAVARLVQARMVIVELAIGDDDVTARAGARRVCLICEPSGHGGPRLPARASAGSPLRCARCEGPLSVRTTDAPALFAARLQRYRANLPGIRTAADQLDVPYHRVAAAADPDAVVNAVLDVLLQSDRPVVMPAASPCTPRGEHR